MSSYKTTLKQQLNGQKRWKIRWKAKSLILFELCCFPVQCLEESWHDNRFSFSSNFSTFFNAVLLKNKKIKTALAISDYNFLSVLPLKERLDYNKRVLIHKIMSEKVPPSLTAKFSLNQSGHSGKPNISIPRSDLFKFSVVYI